MRGGDRVASRVRVAASACLVASGLFMAGAGGAIALADPGHGDDRQDRADNSRGDDSIGDMVRRAFGFGDGNDQKTSEPAGQGPQTRLGNGRQGQYPGGRRETDIADDRNVADERIADEADAREPTEASG